MPRQKHSVPANRTGSDEIAAQLATHQAITVRIPDAVRMIGLGRSKSSELIKLGEIEIVKVGAATLVPTESLAAFVARRRPPLGAPVSVRLPACLRDRTRDYRAR